MADSLTDTLRAFYQAYSRELFTYALSITANEPDAEDAVHDAFSAVLANGALPREIRPYLFRCVRNAAVDSRRSAAREIAKTTIFAEAVPDGLLRVQVEELLEHMYGAERECVVLKVYGGLTFKEIAGVIEEPQGTVAARYWRALAKVREKLETQP